MIGEEEGSHPAQLRLFKDRPNMTFNTPLVHRLIGCEEERSHPAQLRLFRNRPNMTFDTPLVLQVDWW